MKKIALLFMPLLIMAACTNSIDNYSDDDTIVEWENNSLMVESSSFFSGLPLKINPDVVHEMIIIDDAIGCNFVQTNTHGILAYVICLSLVPPIKKDTLGYCFDFIPKDTLLNAPSIALTNVIPQNPVNGTTFTFVDSLGYYHNLIISNLLANDPDGSTYKTMTTQQIVYNVCMKIEHDFHLTGHPLANTEFTNTLSNKINSIRNIQKTSSSESSCISAIKTAHPATNNYIDYIRFMAYVQKSPSILSQTFQNISSSTSLTPMQKTILKVSMVVEFASDRLWKE